MTTGYYCAIFPFCGGGKKKKTTKKTKAFYDWANTGIPVISAHALVSTYPLGQNTKHAPLLNERCNAFLVVLRKASCHALVFLYTELFVRTPRG